MLSDFARNIGLPSLANIDRDHVCHWLTSLHQKGNKSATVSVRYRSLSRFFNWCVADDEPSDNPMDRVDPPKIPDEIQAYYQPHEVETLFSSLTPISSGWRTMSLSGVKQFVPSHEDGGFCVSRRIE